MTSEVGVHLRKGGGMKRVAHSVNSAPVLGIAGHLEAIGAAATAWDLEVAAQAAWKAFPAERTGSRIRSAMKIRGEELCRASPHPGQGRRAVAAKKTATRKPSRRARR